MGIHSNQVRDEIGGVGVLMVARFSTGFLRAITLVNALTSRQFIVECETTPDSQCPVKMQLSDGFRVRYHFVALKSEAGTRSSVYRGFQFSEASK